MNTHNCVLKAIGAVMIAVSLALSGCGTTKQKEPEQPRQMYGVADLQTIVKSHPKYSEYFRQETEYNHMLDQYQQEQQQMMQTASQQAMLKAQVEEQSLIMAAENELQVRLKAKEDELNKRLQGIYMEIMAKHQKDGTANDMDTLTPEERAHMANLQMKLSVTGVTAEEKEEIKKELRELLRARMERATGGMVGWTEEDVKRMTTARDEGAKELDAYMNAQVEDIKANLDAQREALAERIRNENSGADIEAFHEEWKTKLENQQKVMADLKEEIMADIRKEAGRVASEKNLKMIFSQYRANIDALDVTGDIASKVINISK